jgi:uncharacterized protein
VNRIEHELPQVIWEPPTEDGEQDCACAVDVPRVWAGEPSAEAAETDCACASASLSSQAAPPAGALWRLPPALYRAPLPDGRQATFNPAGPAGVVVLNGPAARLLEGFATPAPLTDPTARQLAALGLLIPARATERATRDTSHTLTLWLHLTTRCNLRCAYCYAPRGDERMTAETGRAAVDAALRSALAHGFRAVKLKYAGGEPTLNFHVAQHVHAYARLAAARAGLDLQEVLLSNGVALTQEMLDWLHAEDVRLSISLDGLGASHDLQRPSLSGGESCQHAVRAVDNALARGVRPYISVTVTAYNVDALPMVVAFALERDLSFNLNFVRPLPGGPHLSPSPERLISGLRAALAVIEGRLPRRRLVDGLLDRCSLAGPHTAACGAGCSYLVVDPQGRVAWCHMEMGRVVSSVWEEDPLQAVVAAGEDLHTAQTDLECNRCLWRYVCAGGCPLVAHRMGGGRSPYCEVYRAVLPDLLRLEALRLLKWHA